MRQTITGLVAAIAVVTASAVPALACGGGLFQSTCSPCGQTYVEPCAQPEVYVAPAPTYTYGGCNTGCGWTHERLADPEPYSERVHQYYYVNQGPTFTGPGDFAPVPTYREGGWSSYRHHHHHHYGYEGGRYEGPRVYGYRTHFHPWHHGYTARPSYRYGYAVRHGYAPHFYAPHHNLRYGMPMGMPRAYGHREMHEMHEHMMRRYN